MQKDEAGRPVGKVFRERSGEIYFISGEQLEECRITDPDVVASFEELMRSQAEKGTAVMDIATNYRPVGNPFPAFNPREVRASGRVKVNGGGATPIW